MSAANDSLRASDAERERVAAQLREHCAAGRITPEELDERSDAAFSARTLGELRGLLADLPALPDAGRATAGLQRRHADPARELAKKRVVQRTGAWLLIFVACVAIWAATGAHYFWPMWVLIGGALRVGTCAWSELGPGGDDGRLGRGGSRPIERR